VFFFLSLARREREREREREILEESLLFICKNDLLTKNKNNNDACIKQKQNERENH
jgi:hypothetical protein